MQYTTLGNTGLRVSVAGFGGGGNSRFGLGTGGSEADAVALIRAALDLGVNFFDTAEGYGSEAVLGHALAGVPRDSVVISTKSHIVDKAGNPHPPATVVANLEASLRRLAVDHVDIFHLHGVQPPHYEYALNELVPAVLQQKALGKFRHLGITELAAIDPDQATLSRALDDRCWEVIMLAFHMMNQRPRETLLPRTRAQGVGTLLMFVVRTIFSRPDVLRQTMAELAAKGEVPAELAANSDPLGFLVHDGGATSLTDAAYRFARHEPGADVILFGTGNMEHLRANVASILRPPLPAADVDRLHWLFGQLRDVGLTLPAASRFAPP
jgi:aryl-alcohol dehydrogenase-like predicted oxidoreductase